MNDQDNGENERLEGLLRRARLPEPSLQLKRRVIAEARKAWMQAAPEVPWQIPIRDLAVSAAAAVLVVWLANCSSDYALDRIATGGVRVTGPVSGRSDIDALPEMPYGSVVRRLVSLQPRYSGFDASALNDRAEVFRRILDEAQQSAFSQPSRGGPESRMNPARPVGHSYS